MLAYKVSRPILGISLNGNEYLLDKDGDVLLFEDKQKAVLHMCQLHKSDNLTLNEIFDLYNFEEHEY